MPLLDALTSNFDFNIIMVILIIFQSPGIQLCMVPLIYHYCSGREAALHVVLQLRKMLSLFIIIIHFIISPFHFSTSSISFFFLFIFIMSYLIICTQKRQVQHSTYNSPQYLRSNFLRDKYDQ